MKQAYEKTYRYGFAEWIPVHPTGRCKKFVDTLGAETVYIEVCKKVFGICYAHRWVERCYIKVYDVEIYKCDCLNGKS